MQAVVSVFCRREEGSEETGENKGGQCQRHIERRERSLVYLRALLASLMGISTTRAGAVEFKDNLSIGLL